MKNLKISTLLLIISLLLMSMGFPHQAADEERGGSAGNWGCSRK